MIDEIEEDIYSVTGSRPRMVQKQIPHSLPPRAVVVMPSTLIASSTFSGSEPTQPHPPEGWKALYIESHIG